MQIRFAMFATGLALAGAAATTAAAQNKNPCADHPCNIVFDWGGSSSSPDPDRHFGNPSELEAMFVQTLQGAGFRFSSSAAQEGGMTINVRLTPQNRVICDNMPGTSSDMSCHTVSRASVVFVPNDASQKAPGRVDINPRCSDPTLHPTYASFGEFAAASVVYAVINDSKGDRPAAVKCR